MRNGSFCSSLTSLFKAIDDARLETRRIERCDLENLTNMLGELVGKLSKLITDMLVNKTFRLIDFMCFGIC